MDPGLQGDVQSPVLPCGMGEIQPEGGEPWMVHPRECTLGELAAQTQPQHGEQQ